jgi:hypothetical protein
MPPPHLFERLWTAISRSLLPVPPGLHRTRIPDRTSSRRGDTPPTNSAKPDEPLQDFLRDRNSSIRAGRFVGGDSSTANTLHAKIAQDLVPADDVPGGGSFLFP